MTASGHWHIADEPVREPLHYPDCGLDDVYLVNGYERHETAYGPGITVRNLDQLREAIALNLATHRKGLKGKEVRFLRKQLDLSQSALGRLLGVDAQTVARWEKERTAVPGPAEALLRVVALEHLRGTVRVHDLLTTLDETDGTIGDRQLFEQTDDGWRLAA